jgi:hypothetical protein
MSDVYTVAGSIVKKVGSLQEELHSFDVSVDGDEAAGKTIVLAEVDAAELSSSTEVHSVDLSYINSDPPTDGEVKLVIVEVLTSGKRVVVNYNVPANIITALGTSPITDTSTDPFDSTSYADLTGIIVDSILILGGKVNNLYINRFPLQKTGKDTTADAGDCRVRVRVVGA